MLVEEGFSVMSVDASDKMLKYALKERWNRRREPAFDRWGTSVPPGQAPPPRGAFSLPWAPLHGVGTAVLLSFPWGKLGPHKQVP